MNAATNRTPTAPTTSVTTPPRRSVTVMARRSRPMPRSTTRVIWTRSLGTIVEFGDIA